MSQNLISGQGQKRDTTILQRSEFSLSSGVDQHFYAHGKLLLSGEYFLLDGAEGLSIPLRLGQSLLVKYRPSFDPKLYWRSYDADGKLWLTAVFEFWHFNCLDGEPIELVSPLQSLLREARNQNQHFLRESSDVFVETRLGFPLKWGLGSSSTLIDTISQWAYINPFELLKRTYGGSGYDIACAEGRGPLIYENAEEGPAWTTVDFSPAFEDNLYFVYSGKKQSSQEAIRKYKSMRPYSPIVISDITSLTREMVEAKSLMEFESILLEHEMIVSKTLKLERAKDLFFVDYWGEIKSLGAWGGDFLLVTSNRSDKETKEYFHNKGHKIVFRFSDLVLNEHVGCSPERTVYNKTKMKFNYNLSSMNSLEIPHEYLH